MPDATEYIIYIDEESSSLKQVGNDDPKLEMDYEPKAVWVYVNTNSRGLHSDIAFLDEYSKSVYESKASLNGNNTKPDESNTSKNEQEPAKKEPEKKEPEKKDPEKKEPEKKDPEKKEPEKSTSAPAPVNTKLEVKSGSYKVVSASDGAPAVEYTAADTSSKSVSVPDTITDENGNVYKVTSIASNAFAGNKSLKSVKIGKNVTTIGKGAFKGCKNLKSITINGKNLKKVAKNAFKGIKKGCKIKITGVSKSKAKKLLKLINKKGGAKNSVLK